jgi:pimeloyl-ACP methyl ester carboxylesterase
VTFVLVHGGGFAASCWEPLLPFLDGDVVAVDLPGRGTRPADLEAVTLADFADAVVAEVEERDLRDVVLVGHSLAGVTLPRVIGRVPERLRHAVFVSCAVPPDGTPVAGVLGTLGPGLAEIAARLGDEIVGENGTLHPKFAAALFCNDMDADLTAWTLSRMVPEALGIVNEPVDLAGVAATTVPVTYVRLLRDASLVPEAQVRMAANVGDVEIVDLDAGHMAMISRPEALAEVLNAYA